MIRSEVDSSESGSSHLALTSDQVSNASSMRLPWVHSHLYFKHLLRKHVNTRSEQAQRQKDFIHYIKISGRYFSHEYRLVRGALTEQSKFFPHIFAQIWFLDCLRSPQTTKVSCELASSGHLCKPPTELRNSRSLLFSFQSCSFSLYIYKIHRSTIPRISEQCFLLKFKDFKLNGHVFKSVAPFLPRQLHGWINEYPAKHLFTYKLQHVSKNKLNTTLYPVILCLCSVKCYKIDSRIQCVVKHKINLGIH